MKNLPVPSDQLIYFECPYCGFSHNLPRLIGAGHIATLTSVFKCVDYWPEKKEGGGWENGGCARRFVIELEITYRMTISEIKDTTKE